MEHVVPFLRDLVIIILGIVWIVAGALVAVVAWVTWRLVKSLPRRAEVVTAPAQELYGQARNIMGTAGETARTAKEAVTLISDKAVVPTIAVVSAVVGIRQFFQTLARGARGEEP